MNNKKSITNKNVRVRFAPSPTGELHIGSARTALFNYLFAKHHEGKIILRIEDTDAKRFVKGATERLIESLSWLGIEFDESPYKNKLEKKYGPYIQSERLGLYQEYAQMLVEDGQAYYCFCTESRLEKMREEQTKKKVAPMYDRKCLSLTKVEIDRKLKEKTPYVIRLKVPYSGATEFDDLIRGHVAIDNSTIDDQILIKSDGMPTYHLANVVDDHLMEISHVIRAEEWLPSTPKHLLLYKAFGWNPPVYAHIPLVLAPDRSKLSKRYGAVSVEEFKKSGYLPEALINYIAFLGWSPKDNREFFSYPELIKEFNIEKINKAGAVFDIEKLNHFNAHYIKSKSIKELKKLISIYSKNNLKVDNIDKIIAIIKDRMIKLTDFDELSNCFTVEKKYNPHLLIFKKSNIETTRKGLVITFDELQKENINWESIEYLNQKLLEIVKENSLSNGDVFWPIRVALSGQEKSPSPVEMLWVLGKKESVKRIKKAIKLINI